MINNIEGMSAKELREVVKIQIDEFQRLSAENERLKKLAVEWADLKEERPEFKGSYLTLWTDGALEPYELTRDENLESGWDIALGDSLITHWADFPALPKSQGGEE